MSEPRELWLFDHKEPCHEYKQDWDTPDTYFFYPSTACCEGPCERVKYVPASALAEMQGIVARREHRIAELENAVKVATIGEQEMQRQRNEADMACGVWADMQKHWEEREMELTDAYKGARTEIADLKRRLAEIAEAKYRIRKDREARERGPSQSSSSSSSSSSEGKSSGHSDSSSGN